MKKLQRLAYYFHTTRYLKFRQIFFRAYYSCFRFKIKSIPTLKPRIWMYEQSEWPSCFEPCLSEKGNFSFLGETGNLNDPLIWNDSTHSKLWLYNLHYLNDLNAVNAARRTEILDSLVERWTFNNPLLQRKIGWEPYPLSLRIVNLVKWYSAQKKLMSDSLLSSLRVQAEALIKQIEYHILGNHLFANGKALVFVGAYFEGASASNWLKKGLEILDSEIKEQFLEDGAHFELSPMYHAALLWDMCDLVYLANQSGLTELQFRKKRWQQVIERGLHWLSAMLHPDGAISFFNDAAFDISPGFSNIESYAKQLGIGLSDKGREDFSLQWLKASGYCAVNLGHASKAILDIANIGPDYQPGHAHADTLSLEMSLYGERFLVNSGVSCYGESALRHYQRSTRSHNTVCVDACDSSETWAGFRVARRGYPKDIVVQEESNRIFIGGSHDGYLRLPGKVMHRREWDFTKNSLTICDVITGKFKEVEVRYYFHPSVRIEQVQLDRIECFLTSDRQVSISLSGAASCFVDSSNWYPRFGESIPNHCLVVKPKHAELITHIGW